MRICQQHRGSDQAHRALVLMILLLGSAASGSFAQDSPQPILTAQFSFSNPGARSLGLGGAFVALADDATAAWANPADLVQIARPEVSAEGRYWRHSTEFAVRGRVRGEPSGIGLDTVHGIETAATDSSEIGLAFLSFVYPQDRWSIAVYRHVLANVEAQGATEGLFTEADNGQPWRFLDQATWSNLEVISYGLSAAYRVTDSFSLGLGLVYYRTSMEIRSDLYLWDDLDHPLGSATSYLPERFVWGQTLYGEDSNIGASGGFLWRIGPRWSVGGRYRQGPIASLNGRASVGSIVDLGVPPGSVIEFDFVEDVQLPDNYGLGVAYRSVDGRLTIALEWARVTYSDSLGSLEIDDQDIDDADELRLGGEWVFLGTKPLLAIRAGVWQDPDHQSRANELSDDFTRALLQPGEDEIHFALGVGVAFESFQLDGAFDYSDSVTTASLSAIYSF